MILTFKDGAVVNDKNDLNGIGIYEIEVSDSDAYSIREQLGMKKEHKWKEGDRVKVVGSGDYHGLIGEIYNCDTCGKGEQRIQFEGIGNDEPVSNFEGRLKLYEEYGVRSPEQNPKEIEKLELISDIETGNDKDKKILGDKINEVIGTLNDFIRNKP